MGYFEAHWRGKHSLARSVWINDILIYALIHTPISLLVSPEAPLISPGADGSIVFMYLLILIIFAAFGFAVNVWGWVGVWRSANLYIGNKRWSETDKKPIWGIAAKVFIVLQIGGFITALFFF